MATDPTATIDVAAAESPERDEWLPRLESGFREALTGFREALTGFGGALGLRGDTGNDAATQAPPEPEVTDEPARETTTDTIPEEAAAAAREAVPPTIRLATSPPDSHGPHPPLATTAATPIAETSTANEATAETTHLADPDDDTIQRHAVKLAGSIALYQQIEHWANASDEDITRYNEAPIGDESQREERLAELMAARDEMRERFGTEGPALFAQIQAQQAELADILPEDGQTHAAAFVQAIQTGLEENPNRDLDELITESSTALGEEASFDSLAEFERKYTERIEKYRELLHLRAAMGSDGSLSDFNAALMDLADPPLEVDLMTEVIPNVQATAERGLTHINETIGFKDANGATVRLNDAELEQATLVYSYVFMNELHRLNNRYDGVFGDANYRSADLVTGVGSVSRELWQGGSGIVSGAWDADGLREAGQAAVDAASDAVDNAGDDIQADMRMSHLLWVMDNTMETIAAMRPGVHLERTSMAGGQALEEETIAHMQAHAPEYYAQLMEIARARDPEAEKPAIIDQVVAGQRIRNGALGSAAFPMTGAIVANAPRFQQGQVPFSVAMNSGDSVETAMTFNDLMAGGAYTLDPATISEYRGKGLVVDSYAGSQPAIAEERRLPTDENPKEVTPPPGRNPNGRAQER